MMAKDVLHSYRNTEASIRITELQERKSIFFWVPRVSRDGGRFANLGPRYRLLQAKMVHFFHLLEFLKTFLLYYQNFIGSLPNSIFEHCTIYKFIGQGT